MFLNALKKVYTVDAWKCNIISRADLEGDVRRGAEKIVRAEGPQAILVAPEPPETSSEASVANGAKTL